MKIYAFFSFPKIEKTFPILYSRIFEKFDISQTSKYNLSQRDNAVLVKSVFSEIEDKSSMERCWYPAISDVLRVSYLKVDFYEVKRSAMKLFFLSAPRAGWFLLAAVSCKSAIGLIRPIAFGVVFKIKAALLRVLSKYNLIRGDTRDVSGADKNQTKADRVVNTVQSSGNREVIVSILDGDSDLNYRTSLPVLQKLAADESVTLIAPNFTRSSLAMNDKSGEILSKIVFIDPKPLSILDRVKSICSMNTLVARNLQRLESVEISNKLKTVLTVGLSSLFMEAVKAENEVSSFIRAAFERQGKKPRRALIIPDSNPVNRRLIVALREKEVPTCTLDTCILGADDGTGVVYTDKVFLSGVWNRKIYSKYESIPQNVVNIVGATRYEGFFNKPTEESVISKRIIYLTENHGVGRAREVIKLLSKVPSYQVEVWPHPGEYDALRRVWDSILKDCGNEVRLVSSGERSLLLLKGAIAVIEYSTVGIQAVLSGAVVLSLGQIDSKVDPYSGLGGPKIADRKSLMAFLKKSEESFAEIYRYQLKYIRDNFHAVGAMAPSDIVSSWLIESSKK